MFNKFERHIRNLLFLSVIQVLCIVVLIISNHTLYKTLDSNINYEKESIDSVYKLENIVLKYSVESDVNITSVNSLFNSMKNSSENNDEIIALINNTEAQMKSYFAGEIDNTEIISNLDKVLSLYEKNLDELESELTIKKAVHRITIFIILAFNIFIPVINVTYTNKSNTEAIQTGAKESLRDELTGVWNRKYIEKVLPVFIERHAGGYLFMIDMDHFKEVNDNLGHNVGDEALVDFATAATSALRPNDIICRYGGDEFVIFCADIMDDDAADAVQQRIRTKFAEKIKDTSKNFVTLSCGAVSYNKNKSFHENFKEADNSLYYVKEHGRNRFHINNND